MKHLFLAIALTCISGIPAIAWDEVGPAITGDKYGFMDQNIVKQTVIPVKENGLWGFINDKNKVCIKPKYEEIGEAQYYTTISSLGKYHLKKALIPVKHNGKWGFIKQDGKEAIKPQFDIIGNFYTVESINSINEKEKNGECLVCKDGRYFFINQKGKETKSIDPGITDILNVDGITLGNNRGNIEFINNTDSNNKIINKNDWALVYISNGNDIYLYSKAAKSFSTIDRICGKNNDFAILKVDDSRFSIMNLNSLEIISNNDFKSYHTLDDIFLVAARDNNVCDVYSINDKKFKFTTDRHLKNSLSANGPLLFNDKKDSSRYGLMNTNGKVMIPAEYTSLDLASDNNVIASQGEKSGLLSYNGEILLPFEYSDIKSIASGKYQIWNGTSTGIFDVPNNKWVLPMDHVDKFGKKIFRDWAIWIGKGDKWGIMESDFSREVVPPVYSENEISVGFKTSLDPKNYTIHIKKNGTVSVIRFHDGKTIIPLGVYTGIKGYDAGYIAVKKGSKTGLVDKKTGKQIIPAIHDEIIGMGNGKFLAGNNTNTGGMLYVYNGNGQILKKQAFTMSQQNFLARFMLNWLGQYASSFNFTL